jgi:restriction system protein
MGWKRSHVRIVSPRPETRMPCPEFYYFIRPALEAVSRHPDAHWTDVKSYAVEKLRIKPEDLNERVASGNKTKIDDRVQWALTYLRQAKLVEKSGKGTSAITQRGSAFLAHAPAVIRPSDLRQFEEFVKFSGDAKPVGQAGESDPTLSEPLQTTPLEAMSGAARQIRTELAANLLSRLKEVPPERCERIIVQLMLKLGYGGPRPDAGETLGKTGDGGVDGIIRQDRLGLDSIYLQAKRWSGNSVGTADINGFIGALTTRGASKGVLITTSTFSESAKKIAANVHHLKLSLIDGEELATLMIDHDLGVALEARFDVKRIDSDYFIEE